jgi:aminoglycoside/choline kinase family phosphotransferase
VALASGHAPKIGEGTERVERWLRQRIGSAGFEVELASADASFRSYLRVRRRGQSFIVMDASRLPEAARKFAVLARAFASIGLNVPEVLEADFERGLLLLTDLGTETYLSALQPQNAERLYGDALGALIVLQARGLHVDGEPPPLYDRELLLRETNLFREWLLARYLQVRLDDEDHAFFDRLGELLADSALEQPCVAVHRDYHSRNLMVARRNNPGILDFQDAVQGPLTYDLVSLLRDCYVAWPEKRVLDWAKGYHEIAVQSGVLREENEDRFLRWFDWMGVQRHLKAAGIFARLSLRDGKGGYLQDIPRTLGYVTDVGERYPELWPLADFLRRRTFPLLHT